MVLPHADNRSKILAHYLESFLSDATSSTVSTYSTKTSDELRTALVEMHLILTFYISCYYSSNASILSYHRATLVNRRQNVSRTCL